MATLGIDLGTGSVKAAVVTPDGDIVAKASRSYGLSSPVPGWAESDPAQWLSSVHDAVNEAVDLAPESPHAVGFSGQMHGVVVTDETLRPLRPAILWADTRSASEAREMNNALGAEHMATLGSGAVAGFAGTTIAWLSRNEPELMSKVRHVFQPKDWLRAVLGGQVGTEPSDASGTLLCDVATGTWSDDAIEWCGISAELLPTIQRSHGPAGEVTLAGRQLPCCFGGADTASAIVGMGLRPGEGFVAVGSGAQVVSVLHEPTLDAKLTTHTFATGGDPGTGWYRIGAVQNGGLALEPTLAMLGSSLDEAHAALAEGVSGDDPVFVPYLAGERTPFMDPQIRGSWTGISLGTTREMLLRSALEGVAHAVALGIQAVSDAGGDLPETLPFIGGGSTNPVFAQLLADCANRPLAHIDVPDAAVRGAALLATGQTSNPVPIQASTTTFPDDSRTGLLAQRRERMVSLARASQGL